MDLEKEVATLKEQLEAERSARLDAVKIAQNALEESQKFQNSITQTIPNIIYVYDLEESKSLCINNRVKQVLGYTDDEIANLTGSELQSKLLPSETIKLYRHIYAMLHAADGEVIEVEYAVKRKDGNVIHVHCRESVFRRKDNGEVKQIIGSAEDITKLREKSKELLDQKNFYESILNHIPSDIAVLDKSLKYLFVNPAAVKDPVVRQWIIGKTNEEYSHYRGIPLELMQKRSNLLQQALDEQKLVEFEETVTDSDKRIHKFLRRVNPVLNSRRGIDFLIGYGLNITELRKAQEEMEASEAKNHAILAAIPDLMFIINKEGFFTEMIKNRKHILTEVDFSKHISSLLPENMVNKTLEAIQKVLETGQYQKIDYSLKITNEPRYYEGRLIKYSDQEVLTLIRDTTDERKAALEIKEKKEFIRQVIDTSPDLIFVKNARGGFTLLNKECAKLFGRTVEEVITADNATLYPDSNDGNFYNSIDQKVITEGQEIRVEEKFTTSNGDEIWFSTIKKPLVTNTGEVQVLGIATNITEQRLAKKLLEEREELFRLLSENSKDVISLHKPGGRFIYVSKASKELLGYEPEELTNTQPKDIIHPDDLETIANLSAQDYLLQHGDVLMQHRLLHKDGSTVWVETNIKPILDNNGNISKLQSSVRDITERKKSEVALKTSEKKYRDLIKYSRAYICTHDMKGILQEVNPYMVEMLGYGAEEMIGHNLNSFIPLPSQSTFNSYLKEFRKKNLSEGILTILDTNKEERFLLYKSYKVEEGNSQPYIIVIAQDITDRMITEQQLTKAKEAAEESARIKENFLANMSHEIRTPMNGILGMAGLLGKSKLDVSQQNYVKLIRQSADNLLVIINDILDIAKIEAGKLDLEEIPFNICDTVKTAFQTQIYRAEEKELMYIFEPLDLKHPVLLGDPYRLNQVLLNLLNNAIKFTTEGSITLEVKVLHETKDAVSLEFAVKDTGIGVPENKTEYIFEGFTQAYSSTTRKYGGTGLGLSICRTLVQMQGGNIWVESEEGKGSTFKFSLTYTKYKENFFALQEKETIDFTSLGNVKVLLAEDNEVNIFLAKSLMESWGFKVDVAQTGLEAVEKASHTSYDIILMDIQMPELSGLDATRQIRLLSEIEKANVPIIALTANAIKGDAEKYLSIGMNDYVSKPFDEDILYIKISNQLSDKTVKINKDQSQSTIIEVNTFTEPLYDLTMLHKMSRGNEAFMKRTKSLFIETVPSTIADIDNKKQSADWAGVSAAAHKLKSTIDTLRIQKLQSVIRQIEAGAKSGSDLINVERNILYLKEVMAKVLEQMKAEI